MIRSINDLILEAPSIYGFNGVNDVANFISNTHHSILLNGVLIYAELVNKDGIKSIIITSTSNMNKFMVSIMYDNYNMIHSGATPESIDWLINSLDSKPLRQVKENMILKFVI
jgi:hypothetical protein